MRFLKKASYKDILGKTRENQMSFVEDITDRYSEYELYLSKDDLDELLPENNNENNKEKGTSDALGELIEKLRKKGEAISAIHCPESLYQTYNECNEEDKSTNYLSLCECIRGEDSKKILKRVIKLAIQINQGQYLRKDSKGEEEDKSKGKDIIVIIHEGCEIGCSFFDINNADCVKNNIKVKTGGLIEALNQSVLEYKKQLKFKLEFKVKIAIENIPPFYCTLDEKVPVGQNCWWDRKEKSWIFNKDFFDDINGNKTKSESQEISDNENVNKGGQESNNKNPDVVIGACIDFCHIIASYYINLKETKSIDCPCKEVETDEKTSICNEIKEYCGKIEEFKEYVYLFHVSNYGKNGEHGQNFSMNEDDTIIEKIRDICGKIPEALITFEMADGDDVEKAQRRFDKMLYYFSKKHIAGKLGELLKPDENRNDFNKDLREFFDNLFELYSCDYEDIFTITNTAYEIKKFILENKNQNENSAPFGYNRDRNEEDVALLRIKAYIYYTRFCNLGEYLAENYWNNEEEESFLGEHTKEDFGLAMKYFMLNDIWHQCEYTGVAFKFLIDFLPRKETAYRFYDGIESINEECLETINENDGNFNEIIYKIYTHVTKPQTPAGSFYSMGKNFGQCLFKYYRPNDEGEWKDNEWSLRIYDDLPVNYIQIDNIKYSIPAFLQIQPVIKHKLITNICLDISCFSGGRGKWNDSSEDGPTLWRFINKCLSDINQYNGEGITKMGSIADGEIVTTDLSKQPVFEYNINVYEWYLLIEMYLEMLKKVRIHNSKWDNDSCEVKKLDKINWNSGPDDNNSCILSEEEEKIAKAYTELKSKKEERERETEKEKSNNNLKEIIKIVYTAMIQDKFENRENKSADDLMKLKTYKEDMIYYRKVMKRVKSNE